jgi:hypothetical protein
MYALLYSMILPPLTFFDFRVSHAVIDGVIATDRMYGKDANPDELPTPPLRCVPHRPSAVCAYIIDTAIYEHEQAYGFLSRQHRSAWTWVLDLRPALRKVVIFLFCRWNAPMFLKNFVLILWRRIPCGLRVFILPTPFALTVFGTHDSAH